MAWSRACSPAAVRHDHRDERPPAVAQRCAPRLSDHADRAQHRVRRDQAASRYAPGRGHQVLARAGSGLGISVVAGILYVLGWEAALAVTWTDHINEVATTDIDFPVVIARKVA